MVSVAWLGLEFGVVAWLDLRFRVGTVLASYAMEGFTHEVMVRTFYIFDRIATTTLLTSSVNLVGIGLALQADPSACVFSCICMQESLDVL